MKSRKWSLSSCVPNSQFLKLRELLRLKGVNDSMKKGCRDAKWTQVKENPFFFGQNQTLQFCCTFPHKSALLHLPCVVISGQTEWVVCVWMIPVVPGADGFGLRVVGHKHHNDESKSSHWLTDGDSDCAAARLETLSEAELHSLLTHGPSYLSYFCERQHARRTSSPGEALRTWQLVARPRAASRLNEATGVTHIYCEPETAR